MYAGATVVVDAEAAAVVCEAGLAWCLVGLDGCGVEAAGEIVCEIVAVAAGMLAADWVLLAEGVELPPQPASRAAARPARRAARVMARGG